MKNPYKKGNVDYYRSGIFRKWRWRVLSKGNHKIIGASSQSYWNRLECEDNAQQLGEYLTE